MSKVSDVSDVMRRLLWSNLVEAWARKMIATVPVLGWPVIKDVFFYLLENYLVEPLFTELARFGVFTHIDFRDDAQYQAYKKEALQVIEKQGTSEDWAKEERQAFRDAASNLIVFHLS